MKLTDREWKEFKVKSVFTIEKCKCSNASSLKQGSFSYIGATNRNNGIMSLVEKKESWISKGNCIVFICDGQGSVGYSIYKSEDFIGSTTLKIGRNNYLNKCNAQFLISALDKNRAIYSYGYKRSGKRLLNETILLPFDKNGNPDYAFMEEYIKEGENHKKEKYIDFAKKQIKKLEYIEVPALKGKEWKEFFIKEIFSEVQRGKRLTKSNQVKGDKPYVSSSAMNNGVDNYICNNKNIRTFSDCISLANSGSVGSSFYQPFEFIASDHITHLKNSDFNKYTYLFIATLCSRLSSKYNFNREINDKRISKEKILLPITDDENPDYEYMEQYAKNLIVIKLKKYLAFAKKK